MTAQALPEQIAACREAGMNDYVAKPLSPDALKVMIAKWARADIEEDAARTTDALDGLRLRFLQRSREDLKIIRRALREISPDHAALQALVHRFAGTAGMFGFVTAGETARALDEKFTLGKPIVESDFEPLVNTLEELASVA